MTYQPKPYTGSLFPNDKGDNPNRPDWKGSAVLEDGHKIYISGWNKVSAKGDKYMSLSLNEAQEPAQASNTPAPAPLDDGDEIAF